MKRLGFAVFAVLLGLTIFTACNKKEVAAPPASETAPAAAAPAADAAPATPAASEPAQASPAAR